MAATVHHPIPAQFKPPVETVEEPCWCVFSAEAARVQAPLTSEPPLPDAEPLTSEPPLADAAPLTSEPGL
ncbi:hypothetical protein ACFWIJ_08850 [Streptomyces sp. NPDC127079]|uniref:hypothetical protein n=1 Tax=Streptomyces sp. NPDC127079 TaxID=3347132 RepID=UPI0036564866